MKRLRTTNVALNREEIICILTGKITQEMREKFQKDLEYLDQDWIKEWESRMAGCPKCADPRNETSICGRH